MKKITIYHTPDTWTSINVQTDSATSRETTTTHGPQSLEKTVDARAKDDRDQLATFARAILDAIKGAPDRNLDRMTGRVDQALTAIDRALERWN